MFCALLSCSWVLAGAAPTVPPLPARPPPVVSAPPRAPAARAAVERPSLAVFRLEPKHGVPAGAADLLTDTLLNEVRASGAFGRVVSPTEIAALMVPEQQQFLVRCASDECALVDNELAGALGVTHILVGSLGKLGASYLLNLRLLDVQSSVLLASLSERARGDSEEALLDMVRPAARRLLREAGMVADPEAVTAAPVSALRKALRGSGAALLLGGGLALVPAAAALAAVAGVTIYNVAQGWRPGQVQRIPAVVGLTSDVLYVGGVVLVLLGVLGASVGTVLLISGMVP